MAKKKSKAPVQAGRGQGSLSERLAPKVRGPKSIGDTRRITGSGRVKGGKGSSRGARSGSGFSAPEPGSTFSAGPPSARETRSREGTSKSTRRDIKAVRNSRLREEIINLGADDPGKHVSEKERKAALTSAKRNKEIQNTLSRNIGRELREERTGSPITDRKAGERAGRKVAESVTKFELKQIERKHRDDPVRLLQEIQEYQQEKIEDAEQRARISLFQQTGETKLKKPDKQERITARYQEAQAKSDRVRTRPARQQMKQIEAAEEKAEEEFDKTLPGKVQTAVEANAQRQGALLKAATVPAQAAGLDFWIKPVVDVVKGTGGDALDLLHELNRSAAGMANVAMGYVRAAKSDGIFGVLSQAPKAPEAFAEGWDNNDVMFSDVLEEAGVENGIVKYGGGFILDVLFDPLTYLTLGGGGVVKAGTTGTTRLMAGVSREAAEVGAKATAAAVDSGKGMNSAMQAGWQAMKAFEEAKRIKGGIRRNHPSPPDPSTAPMMKRVKQAVTPSGDYYVDIRFMGRRFIGTRMPRSLQNLSRAGAEKFGLAGRGRAVVSKLSPSVAPPGVPAHIWAEVQDILVTRRAERQAGLREASERLADLPSSRTPKGTAESKRVRDAMEDFDIERLASEARQSPILRRSLPSEQDTARRFTEFLDDFQQRGGYSELWQGRPADEIAARIGTLNDEIDEITGLYRARVEQQQALKKAQKARTIAYGGSREAMGRADVLTRQALRKGGDDTTPRRTLRALEDRRGRQLHAERQVRKIEQTLRQINKDLRGRTVQQRQKELAGLVDELENPTRPMGFFPREMIRKKGREEDLEMPFSPSPSVRNPSPISAATDFRRSTRQHTAAEIDDYPGGPQFEPGTREAGMSYSLRALNNQMKRGVRTDLVKLGRTPDEDDIAKVMLGETEEAIYRVDLDADDAVQQLTSPADVRQAMNGGDEVTVLNRNAVEFLKEAEKQPGYFPLDKFTRYFRVLATIPNPQYWVRNAYDDLWRASYFHSTLDLARANDDTARIAKRIRQRKQARRKDTELAPTNTTVAGQPIDDVIADLERHGVIGGGVVAADIGTSMGKVYGWNESRENYTRALMYVAGIRKGESPAKSALQTRTALFDYGNLTNFERTYMRRIFPFYTFRGRNIPLQASTLFTRPGKIARYGKAQEEASRAAGLEEGWEDESLNEIDRLGLPIPIPVSREFNGEKLPFAIFPGMSVMDLDLVTGGAPAFGKQALSASNPVAKLPVELLTGHSFFYRDKIDGPYRKYATAPRALHDFFERLEGAGVPKDWSKTGDDAWGNKDVPQIPARLLYALTALPETGFGAKFGTALDEVRNLRTGTSPEMALLGYGTGFRPKIIDAKNKELGDLFNLKEYAQGRKEALSELGEGQNKDQRKEMDDYWDKQITQLNDSIFRLSRDMGIPEPYGIKRTPPNADAGIFGGEESIFPKEKKKKGSMFGKDLKLSW